MSQCLRPACCLTPRLTVMQIPPCVVTEYCSRGSLADMLRAAKQSATAAAKLDWGRRLRLVRWCYFEVNQSRALSQHAQLVIAAVHSQ